MSSPVRSTGPTEFRPDKNRDGEQLSPSATQPAGLRTVSKPHLWPEPHYGTNTADDKDRVENAAKKAVCAGKVSLHDAQQDMLKNWTTAESNLGISTAP